eukprot:COSAG02_NODE_47395_length_341_cov_1.004132_1_plen_58_part_10
MAVLQVHTTRSSTEALSYSTADATDALQYTPCAAQRALLWHARARARVAARALNKCLA